MSQSVRVVAGMKLTISFGPCMPMSLRKSSSMAVMEMDVSETVDSTRSP